MMRDQVHFLKESGVKLEAEGSAVKDKYTRVLTERESLKEKVWALEGEVSTLEGKVSLLTSQLEARRRECTELTQKKEEIIDAFKMSDNFVETMADVEVNGFMKCRNLVVDHLGEGVDLSFIDDALEKGSASSGGGSEEEEEEEFLDPAGIDGGPSIHPGEATKGGTSGSDPPAASSAQ